MLYYGMEKGYLSDFNRRLSHEGDKVRVIYENGSYSGWCEYTMYKTVGKSKPIKQDIWLLINTDMGDVIEYLHKKTPLSSEDFNEVNMLIRTDSLSFLLSQNLQSN